MATQHNREISLTFIYNATWLVLIKSPRTPPPGRMLREPQTHQLAALHHVLVAKLEVKDPRLFSSALHAPRRLEEANEQVLDSRLLSQIPGIPAGLHRQAHVDTALQKHKIRARTHTHMHDREVADERRLDHQAKNCTEKYKTPSFDDNQGRRTKAKTS